MIISKRLVIVANEHTFSPNLYDSPSCFDFFDKNDWKRTDEIAKLWKKWTACVGTASVPLKCAIKGNAAEVCYQKKGCEVWYKKGLLLSWLTDSDESTHKKLGHSSCVANIKTNKAQQGINITKGTQDGSLCQSLFTHNIPAESQHIAESITLIIFQGYAINV